MQTYILLSLTVLIPGLTAVIYAFVVNTVAYKDDPRKKPIVNFSLALGAWLLLQLPFVTTNSLRYAGLFFYVQQFVTIIAAYCYFLVVKSLISKDSKLVSKANKAIPVLMLIWFVLILVFPTFDSVRLNQELQIPDFVYNSVNYNLYVSLPTAIVVFAQFVLLRAKNIEHRIKRQVTLETIFLVLSLIVLTFAYPTYFSNNSLIVEYFAVGFSLLIYLLTFSRTVLQSRLVDFRANSWRLLLSISTKFVVISLTYSLYLLVGRQYELTWLAHNTILLFGMLTTGIVLWLTDILVKRYLQRFHLDLDSLTKSAQRIEYNESVSVFSEKFLQKLSQSIGAENLLLVVNEHNSYKVHEYAWDGVKAKTFLVSDKEDAVYHYLDTILNRRKKKGVDVLTRQEVRDTPLDSFNTVISLNVRAIRVVLLIGAKKDGGEYLPSDISVISSAVNEFALTLENALQFEEIQNFAETLQAKVDDATRKLRRTNEKLKALDETKDEFISMASHQLRTPLTSVKGYVSMVLEEDAGKINKQQRKLLDQAFVSSQRMVYLIADLLNVSRLRTGKFVIEAKPTNLADVIEGEVSQLVETAKARDLTLTYHKPKDFPVLSLDETKTRQVIMNFVDNAIYYTPSGGHITINLEDKGKTIEYTVVDDGIGVPKSEQHHLFSKFYRAGNAKKARPDGTGLGLFMAKKVIVAQGGAVIFHSEEGKGSTFGFSFPKAKLNAAPTKSPTH